LDAFFRFSCVLHSLPISSHLIWLSYYFLRSNNYKALHHVIFSSALLRLQGVQINILTRLGVGQPTNRCSVPAKGERLFCSQRSHRIYSQRP
jgi:hypothetical protein